jgi:hypothetical protein
MLTWLKQVFNPLEKKGQKGVLHFPVLPLYSAEKHYLIESLKLKGYLLVEDLELNNHLIIDIFLKKERMAIFIIDDVTSSLERINRVKIRAAVHEQGFQCFIFERSHFYKSLARLHFRLRQPTASEVLPPSIH